MPEKIKSLLVDDWRSALQWSTVRLHLIVMALSAVFSVMPELDPALAHLLPTSLQNPSIGVYAALALALRLTKLKSA